MPLKSRKQSMAQLKSNKLSLTDTELDQEVNIFLSAEDPNVSKEQVTFSHKDYEFKKLEDISHLAIHYSAANKVELANSDSDSSIQEEPVPVHDQTRRKSEILWNGAPEKEIAESSQTSVKEEDAEDSIKKLSNQFNFSERSTQTFVRATKNIGIQTKPRSKTNFSANITQWDIYDFYTVHSINQEKAKEIAKHTTATEVKDEERHVDLSYFKNEKKKPDLGQLMKPLRIAERMINQNTYDEITQDFKYWEDLSDELKGSCGSLLPLWKFVYNGTQGLSVTCIAWNPTYSDVFVASYGSYDFMNQKHGLICCFTLNNPSHPEGTFRMAHGAMSVDINPDCSHHVAVGLYDGNVAVLNLNESKNPVCQSHAWKGKHLGPVWQVQWQSDDMDGNMNFYSVGGDGKMKKWTLVKNNLEASEILILPMREVLSDDFSLSSSAVRAGIMAFHFHPIWKSVYLTGSDEGRIQKYNITYTNENLMDYEVHNHSVNKIQWNNFHPDIYISCSPDHTVKIWDHKQSEPVCSFNLGSPVADVQWAPYSATVFAAATVEGKVHLYDLHANKYHPICVQLILPKKTTWLTCLSFSKTFPVILVGDAMGCVRSFKLSPNLRKSMANIENKKKHHEQEVINLEKCLCVFKNKISAG